MTKFIIVFPCLYDAFNLEYYNNINIQSPSKYL